MTCTFNLLVLLVFGFLWVTMKTEEFNFKCSDHENLCSVCTASELSCVRLCEDGLQQKHKTCTTPEFKVEDFRTLKRDWVNITVTGNNFQDHLPANMFGNCSTSPNSHMTSLTYLNLSRNNITTIHGKTFHCVNRLETLDLSHNNWHVDNHTHVFSSMGRLKTLILENTFFEKLNGTKHLAKLAWYINVTGMPKLTHLNLAGNEFWAIPEVTKSAFCQFQSLRTLNLSQNLLTSPDLCGNMSKLEVLDLSHNRLPWLSKELIGNLNKMKNLKKLYLHGNLLQCDCGMIPFYTWLKNTTLSAHVQNPKDLTCTMAFNTVNERQPIVTLQLSDLKCSEHFQIFNATGVVIGFIIVIIVGLFVATLYFKRNSVRMAWKNFFAKPVKLSLIPQSQGYSTVHNQAM